MLSRTALRRALVHRDDHEISPRRSAWATAWVRLRTPNRVVRSWTTVLTVRSLYRTAGSRSSACPRRPPEARAPHARARSARWHLSPRGASTSRPRRCTWVQQPSEQVRRQRAVAGVRRADRGRHRGRGGLAATQDPRGSRLHDRPAGRRRPACPRRRRRAGRHRRAPDGPGTPHEPGRRPRTSTTSARNASRSSRTCSAWASRSPASTPDRETGSSARTTTRTSSTTTDDNGTDIAHPFSGAPSGRAQHDSNATRSTTTQRAAVSARKGIPTVLGPRPAGGQARPHERHGRPGGHLAGSGPGRGPCACPPVVTNTGTVVDALTLDVVGLSDGWAQRRAAGGAPAAGSLRPGAARRGPAAAEQHQHRCQRARPAGAVPPGPGRQQRRGGGAGDPAVRARSRPSSSPAPAAPAACARRASSSPSTTAATPRSSSNSMRSTPTSTWLSPSPRRSCSARRAAPPSAPCGCAVSAATGAGQRWPRASWRSSASPTATARWNCPARSSTPALLPQSLPRVAGRLALLSAAAARAGAPSPRRR